MSDDQKPWLGGVRSWAADAQGVLENVAKAFLVTAILGSMAYFANAADPGKQAPYADRILSWTFAVFAVGLAELFVLFVILSVMGKIDLAQAFYDKPVSGEGAAEETGDKQDADSIPVSGGAAKAGAASNAKPGPEAPASTPPVSLARLQAFLWTLLVMTIYFHRVVKDGANSLPAIPPELLMAMGISGATYLVSKGMSASAESAKTKPDSKADGKVTPAPKPQDSDAEKTKTASGESDAPSTSKDPPEG